MQNLTEPGLNLTWTWLGKPLAGDSHREALLPVCKTFQGATEYINSISICGTSVCLHMRVFVCMHMHWHDSDCLMVKTFLWFFLWTSHSLTLNNAVICGPKLYRKRWRSLSFCLRMTKTSKSLVSLLVPFRGSFTFSLKKYCSKCGIHSSFLYQCYIASVQQGKELFLSILHHHFLVNLNTLPPGIDIQ